MATMSPPVSPQPVQPVERPRPFSSMSHASTSSRKSKGSNKLELVESPRDKKRFNAESKADPTAALNEATPGMQCASQTRCEQADIFQAKSLNCTPTCRTYAPRRGGTRTVISSVRLPFCEPLCANPDKSLADPDRSNPSRPRMERPLDTIRSFNAAAEGTASRRSSSYGNRPSTYFCDRKRHHILTRPSLAIR